MGLKSGLARALVRWRSRYITASYLAYTNGAPGRERFWGWMGDRVERIAFPLARRLDGDAMGQQMVEEAWWG